MHYHGTPITPRSALLRLTGRNFCVSFSAPNDIKVCHQIGQSVMLDNGAYSVWKLGQVVDWQKWAEWAEPWLDCPTTWAVLPDSIEGDEEENDRLVAEWAWITSGNTTVPVWHLHESLGRLERLTATFGRVCFGSSGTYASVGTDVWRRRMDEAFHAISDPSGRVPWTHMLRGMSLSGQEFPFASVDSTDVARNHYLPHNDPVAMAERWDALQCPHTWTQHRQLMLDGEAVA